MVENHSHWQKISDISLGSKKLKFFLHISVSWGEISLYVEFQPSRLPRTYISLNNRIKCGWRGHFFLDISFSLVEISLHFSPPCKFCIFSTVMHKNAEKLKKRRLEED